MTEPAVVARRDEELSPWVTLVTRSIESGGHGPQGDFHSFAQADYVSVLAVTSDGRFPLVRQFRPALERFTLELPGGLLDPGEAPATCAGRELTEETGFAPVAPLHDLGPLDPDTGRLENRLWCFAALDVEPVAGWAAEPGVEVELVGADELVELVRSGEFGHALHVAILGRALLDGLVPSLADAARVARS